MIPELAQVDLPQALKRRRCAQCTDAYAELECLKCRHCYCHPCSDTVHGLRTDSQAMKVESRSNNEGQYSHEEHIERCNVCPQCLKQEVEFFCVQCAAYQCESCCASLHITEEALSAHLYFAVEGSRGSLVQYAKWSVSLFERTRESRRQKIAASLEQQTAVEQADTFVPDRTYDVNNDEEMEAAIKEEKTEQENSASEDGLESLAIHKDEIMPNIKVETTNDTASNTEVNVKLEVPVAKTIDQNRFGEDVDFVDLTDNKLRNQALYHDVPGDMTQHDMDMNRTSKSSWLEAAATWSDDTGINDMMDVTTDFGNAGSDDPIKDALMNEYIRLSESIFCKSREIKKTSDCVKALMANAKSMDEMLRCRRETEKAQTECKELSVDRNKVVAKLLVYVHADTSKFKSVLSSMSLNIEHVQNATHRKCASLEAEIQQNRSLLQAEKAQMDEAIRMKTKESFEKIAQLAVSVQKLEQAIKKLQSEQLEELEHLLIYSREVREVALELIK